MAKQDCVVAVFSNYSEANDTVTALSAAGFGPYLSIVGRDGNGLNTTEPIDHGDEMEKSAAVGAATGATLGLLASTALLVIPGLGPVLFVGAIASGITGGIVGGMSGWGIKEDHAEEYEEDLRANRTLVIAKADPLRLAEIESQLEQSVAERVTLHAEPADTRVDA